jgi:hypothetical protein
MMVAHVQVMISALPLDALVLLSIVMMLTHVHLILVFMVLDAFTQTLLIVAVMEMLVLSETFVEMEFVFLELQ